MTYRYHRRSRHPIFLLWCLPLLLLLIFLFPTEKEKFISADSNDRETAASEEFTVTLAQSEGSVLTILLEDYICGVVAAEMPASFHSEALKAQSVVARTYTLWKMESSSPGHPNADLCDDPSHCQAYKSSEALRSEWGSDFEEKYSRICSAVDETHGEVLTYQNSLAEAYYHSTCGGHTASAQEVWGEDIPYLQSVSCQWDSDAPRYQETLTVPLSELPWLLGDGVSPCIAVSENESVSYIPEITAETESGRIRSVSYGGLFFDGIDFRSALQLNSASFRFSTEKDNLVITTRGYGHGVGMCQYGADGMAKAGKSYQEILKHYYQKINIENR